MAASQASVLSPHRAAHDGASKSQPHSELDIALPEMDALSDELNRLAAVNAELVGRLRGAAAQAGPAAASRDSAALEVLRRENAELRGRVEELEQALLASSDESTWADRQREYEALLEEKSEVIRALHLKIQELQEGSPRRGANERVPEEEELIQLKQQLQEQQRQLQEDEQSLMTQMRQMELALSKDRAELARQRQEVQRLQAEMNREAEHAGRDDGLRERLATLRRPQEGNTRKDATPPPADKQKSSGLFKRLFG